jgi:hypothetical protein
MSVVYIADVFCDGCSQWMHGATGVQAPSKREARATARREHWLHIGGRDFCPTCARKHVTFPIRAVNK